MRILPVLALAACGNSSYYPVYTGPTDFDTDPGSGDTIPCSAAPDGVLVDLTVANRGTDDVWAWVVDPTTCGETYWGAVPGQGTLQAQADHGLVWVLRQPSGPLVTWFVVPSDVTAWTEEVP